MTKFPINDVPLEISTLSGRLLPILMLLIGIIILTKCSSTEILQEPLALQTSNPLAAGSDGTVEVTLYWVIVRNGPGTWASNANWDEYLLQVRNLSDQSVQIAGLSVVDSLNYTLDSSADLQTLIGGSQTTANRYKDSNIDVRAGIGTDTMVATGAAMTLTGAAAVAATTTVSMTGLLGGSAGWAVSGPAAAAVGVLIAGPLIIREGMERARNEEAVSTEIRSRQSRLPMLVESDGERALNLFFPIAPSLKMIEVTYRNASGEHTFVLKTQAALNGLHLEPDS